jgi:hypothetical protein
MPLGLIREKKRTADERMHQRLAAGNGKREREKLGLVRASGKVRTSNLKDVEKFIDR